MHPPHLPPKQNRVVKQSKDFYVILFFTILVSFASGIASAMVAFTWILPPFPALRTSFTFFQNSQDAQDSALSEEEKKYMNERTLQVFDTRKKLSGDFFTAAAFLGSAPLLTLDGWAVFTAPVTQSDLPFLQVLDSQGRVFAVEQLVVDSKTGLVYLNVQGEGFPVFAWTSGVPDTQKNAWFVKQNNITPTQMVISVPTSKETSDLLTNSVVRILDTSLFFGFVVNEKAELVGLVQKNSKVIPSTEFGRHLRFLQKSGTISAKNFSVSGYVVQGVQKDETGKTQSKYGFFVTDIGTKLKIGLLPNDIITHLEGKHFDPQTAREEILNGADEMLVTVLRQGKSIEVKVKKI